MRLWVLMAAASLGVCGCVGDRRTGSPGASSGEPDPYPVLVSALESGQPPLQAYAAEGFIDLGRPAPRGLLESLADAPEYRLRTAALAALGVTRRPDLVPLFKRKRLDPEPTVRLSAAFGLAMAGDASQVTALRDGLVSSRLTDRRTAAWLLGLMGNRSAVGLLAVKLDDPDAVVVLRAAEAMHRLGSAGGLDRVRTLLGHSRHPVRGFATRLLGKMGEASDIPRLERLCQSRSLDVRFAAIASLARLGDFKRVNTLLVVLTVSKGSAPEVDGLPVEQVRVLAARELGESGYRPALAALGRLMAEGNALERTAAAVSIGRIQSDPTAWRERILEDEPGG